MASSFKHGLVGGSTVAIVLPTVYFGFQAWIKARSNNVGSVFLGGSTSVVVASTATDVVSGLELAPGDMMILQGPGNLSNYYMICNNAGDDITYMVES